VETSPIDGLASAVTDALRPRAAVNGRSPEAEVRADVIAPVPADVGAQWVDATRGARGADLELPARHRPRPVDLA
jgi:plasmid stability protein